MVIGNQIKIFEKLKTQKSEEVLGGNGWFRLGLQGAEYAVNSLGPKLSSNV
jgi:hypothetical protein